MEINWNTCLESVELVLILMQWMEPLKIPLDLLELIVDLWINWNASSFLSSPFLWVECVFFAWKSSESKSCRTVRAWSSVGITDLLLLNSPSVLEEILVSTCNAVGLPTLVPVVDFLVVELSEIEIVLESLVDCVCFADMIKSLKTAISSSEELFCTDFKGKSVLGVAFFVEKLLSLGSNVSEMLEESIWDWVTTSVSQILGMGNLE